MTCEYSVLAIEVDQGDELVVRVIRLQPEHTLAQTVILAKGLRSCLCRGHEVLDHRGRNVVAVERRLERALELAGLRDEPVALQDTVVDSRIAVLIGCERAVECVKRRGAIGLVPVGLEQRVVLRVGERHLPTVAQRDDGMLDIGVRQH